MGNKETLKFEPDYAVAPGETLQETLDYLGMSQVELSQRTGLSKKTINGIIKGKEPISENTAIQFEKVFRIPARFWINLESNFRQALARIEEKNRLEQASREINKFPFRDLVKAGVVSDVKDKLQKTYELLTFFGVRDFKIWGSVWNGSNAAFRESRVFKKAPESVAAWLRIGELKAQEIKTQPYSAQKFKQALDGIRSELVNRKIGEIWDALQERCANAGIALVCVPELKKTHASGASHWLGPDKGVIQLSFRGKSDDQFWFTFFHEAGHILKHKKKEGFIDDGEIHGPKEEEADKFAQEILIPHKAWDNFINANSRYSANVIISFASEQELAPGIVVGRLQHDDHLPKSHLNKLKVFIKKAELSQISGISLK